MRITGQGFDQADIHLVPDLATNFYVRCMGHIHHFKRDDPVNIIWGRYSGATLRSGHSCHKFVLRVSALLYALCGLAMFSIGSRKGRWKRPTRNLPAQYRGDLTLEQL